MGKRIEDIIRDNGRAIPMLRDELIQAPAESPSLVGSEPSNVGNEPLRKFSIRDRINKQGGTENASTDTEELLNTQAQRLGQILPNPNSNKVGGTLPKVEQTPTDVPLQKKSAEDMQKIDEANRRNYVLDGDYETAMKKGDISPAEYVQAMKHKAQTEGRELDAYETALSILKEDDTLTPEQQAKKERRERLGQVLSNVGNLIGNVANVYYASKGGLPINLNTAQVANNERYLQAIERRKALEQKGKETLLAAKQQDIKAAREAAIEARKQAQDLYKFNTQLEFDRDKHNSELENKKEKDAADAAKNKAEQEYKNKELEEKIRSNKANEAYKWSEYNARKEGGYYDRKNGNDEETRYKDTISLPDGRYLQLDRSKIGDTVKSEELNWLYQQVPEEIKKAYPTNYKKSSANVDNMYNAIFAAAQSNPQIAQYIIASGMGQYISEEEKVIKTPQKSGYAWGDSKDTNNNEIKW